MIPPINTIKHYVHLQNVGVLTNVILNHEIVDAVVAPASAAANQVHEGSIVKAVFIEIWVTPVTGVTGIVQFDMVVEKVASDGPDMTNTNIVNLGAYKNKKNILYVTQGVARGEGSNPIPLYRNWILIPKGKQRMGLGDRVVVNLMPLGSTTNFCGITTFKEFT